MACLWSAGVLIACCFVDLPMQAERRSKEKRLQRLPEDCSCCLKFMACLLYTDVLLTYCLVNLPMQAILLKFMRFLEDWSCFMKLMSIWCHAGLLFRRFADTSDLLKVDGAPAASLWSPGVLLAYCSFDLPMQAICLKSMERRQAICLELMERHAFDLLVACWPTVPSARFRVCLFGLLLLKSSCSWWAVKKQP
jgi:hypothetical protein